MESLLSKFKAIKNGSGHKFTGEEQLKRQVDALYGLVANLYGSDKIVLRAGKLNALKLMRSDKFEERALALQKLVFEDPTFETIPSLEDIPEILEQIEEEVADILAKRTVEGELEKKINKKLQQRHDDYMHEIKVQALKESTNPENAHTLKKLAILEKMEQKKLARSAIEKLRPSSIEEIAGQERALKSLLAKMTSPFPQHIILYGPPGVGKTTAARLALDVARNSALGPFEKDAPFIEISGSTLRWDPREVTNPLLGSVHDPIYQGARRELADSGIPEPKFGLVTDAHGGVLFIDEIGEMDPLLQNKLLKVLEDKRVHFESSYYDPHDQSIPQYVRKVFEEGAPADFLLIGATTQETDNINPALRSRCAEVFFEPLTPGDIKSIVIQAAKKLDVMLEESVSGVISRYTIDGRKAVGILADAYSLACYREKNNNSQILITEQDAYEVVKLGRLTPYDLRQSSSNLEVGKVFALGVLGFLGSLLEIEAVVFPSRKAGRGAIRFNDTAGSMTKDSVFNAASVIRKITEKDLADYDVHVNVVGGGHIDGPSAGAAIFLAIYSALEERALPQDMAITGELSIQGKIKPVGSIPEKIYGARQTGIKKIFIPSDNLHDVPPDLTDIEIVPVSAIEEMIAILSVKT
ncbi:MAG TPA: ATP-dependent protease, Lon family [Desulfotomaculum sp.]|nr:MAG: Sigma 54 interacting domain protein [Desulfotomaculum sp. 46_80]HAG10681.1 ATP-dependent protease, Lon family [Desulfotomaculum sp.]HBY04974.1 ATP-dependent protease, Lon family [Desulfotomaculum sp.]